MPLLLSGAGLRAVTLLGFCCYAAGIATTVLVREPVGLALDEVSDDLHLKPASTGAKTETPSPATLPV
ncbi:hypothetical protein [Mycobacterium sp. 852002-40037_SCH5390672]|uniref:hypothetical protein n=1 Tax=Mycobacterium sp. 852002-40037_SCH5390672 TaxID=1834089 RepID=UPI0012E97E45|nr:hypothetical protein [Mycobacterium sp. 852002-40037_SCH5390672]